MSGLFGQYLRGMFPIISSAPVAPPEREADESSGIDPAAAESVFRSYHHRLGRPPSLDELRAAMGLETGATSPPSRATPEQPYQLPHSADVEYVARSFHNRFGRFPTNREIQLAVSDFPPPFANAPKAQEVVPALKPEHHGRSQDETVRSWNFPEMLRRLELENMRGRMGLDTDRPGGSSQFSLPSRPLPPPTALDEILRKFLGPIQRLFDEREDEKMRRRMDELPYHERTPRG